MQAMVCFNARNVLFQCKQWFVSSQAMVCSNFVRTGSLTPRLINNRFSHYQFPVTNHAAKVDVCVANWYSLAREIIDFSYFPKF